MECRGIRVLSHAVLDCDLHRMGEAVVASLLRLYNDPNTRLVRKRHPAPIKCCHVGQHGVA